jgi:2-succinyl-6-hydroxy-2,4-cyclohexadiene-1-carboxylate synthase
MTRYVLDALGWKELNVAVTGGGPAAIVALHGFTGNHAQWDTFAGAAAAEGYTVVTPDLPGHGESDAPGDPRLYDMDHTVRALAEVLDLLKLDRVHWLGYSLGGRIAIGAAVGLPARTLSLTAVSASPGLVTEPLRLARRLGDAALADRLNHRGITDFIDYWETLPLWKSQARLSAEARDRLRAQRLANKPNGLANSLRGIGVGSQPDFRDGLKKLNVPALFIAGEEDRKYADLAREMAELVPDGRVSLIPESGHAVHLEQPEALDRAVLDFLKDVTRGPNR